MIQSRRKLALRAAVIYAVVAAAWIVLSDLVVESLFADNVHALSTAQTLKGWLFVSLNAVALYALLRYVVSARLRIRAARETRAQTERALNESAARLAGILDSAMDGIVTMDARHRIIQFNPAAERIFGCNAGDMVGQPLDALLPKEARAAHRDHVGRFGASGKSARHMGALGVVRGRRADGEEIPIEASISQVEVLGEKYFTAILRDVSARQHAEDELRESEQRFRQLAEHVREVFFLTNPANSEMLYVSPAYEEIWGRSCESLYARPQTWADAVHPDDRETVREGNEQSVQYGRFDYEYRIMRDDGSLRWIRTRGFPITDENGKPYRVAGVAEDITERKQAEHKINRLNRVYAVLSGINSAIVHIHDRQQLLDDVCRIAVTVGNFRLAWIGKIDPDTLAGEVVASFGGGGKYLEMATVSAREDAESSRRPASRAVREQKAIVCNDIAADPDTAPLGETLLADGIRSGAAFPLAVDGDVVGVLSLFAEEVGFFDEQELRLLNELATDIGFGLQYIGREERLKFLAYYDDLTGLPNSTLFHDRLTQMLRGAEHEKEVVTMMLIDLDRFTHLNDTFGRQVGNVLLQTAATRLKTAVRAPGSVARISADAFAIAVADRRHGTEVASILHRRIADALREPIAIESNALRLSATAGVAFYPSDGQDAETLFKNAEAALQHAQSGGERLMYYAPEMNAEVAETLALEDRLRTATERGEFELHYQPQVAAGSGRVVGVEALIRWNDPQRGLIAPARFISLLEETGLIVDVGHWVLEQALADVCRWQAQGLRPPRVAINVSAVQLRQSNFAEKIRQVLAASGVGPGALELELTESLIMEDIESNLETLRRISELGVTIAIDDFGTGYSSLYYLAKLPIDTLKIDRSFIVRMVEDADIMAIVSAVISLAHALDMKVVAEGVDSEEQAKFLRLLKCDEIQGFLFSRPMPASACAAWLGQDAKLGAIAAESGPAQSDPASVRPPTSALPGETDDAR